MLDISASCLAALALSLPALGEAELLNSSSTAHGVWDGHAEAFIVCCGDAGGAYMMKCAPVGR